MAGTQIRWRSVGRGAAIAAAVIAGIFSLPALLGNDKPPPVPPDVGLAPPAAAPQAAAAPPPASSASPSRSSHHRMARRRPHRRRSHPRRQRSHTDRRHYTHHDQPRATPAPSSYSPPVYSDVPAPPRPEFGFER
jgi:hypothetical protein